MNKNKIIPMVALIVTTGLIVGCKERINTSDIPNKNNGIVDENKNLENKESENTYINKEYLILANKQNHLGKEYIPDKLTELTVNYIGSQETKYLKDEASKALELLFEAAKSDGVQLMGKSAYRSYNTQVATYNSKIQKLGQTEADKFSAKPGASEHQTGLAIDIISSEFGKLHTDFQYTNTYKWLVKNCAKYGFILRYPKGTSGITGYNFEPWHYRYVGIEHAEKIMNDNLTLEEYLNSL